MKVFVSVGHAVAVALLDSGLSHNFIDTEMARRAGLSLHARSGLSIVVANVERVVSLGPVLDQTVHIGGKAFNIDLYALPLGEYDMVLDVQWLGTLAPSCGTSRNTPWRSSVATSACDGTASMPPPA